MTLVVVPQINNNDLCVHTAHNAQANVIRDVVNGNLDDTNIASISGTKISDGTVTGAKLANASVTNIVLNVTETTDVTPTIGTAISVSTWSDIRSNQTFSVSSTSSIIQININGALVIGNSGTPTVYVRANIDSAGTPIFKTIAAGRSAPGLYGTVNLNSSIFLTGLSAGTHTIKTQINTDLSTTMYLRPFTVPAEFYATQIIEHKK